MTDEHPKTTAPHDDDLDTRLHATSHAVQRLLDMLNRGSPINLELLTGPIAHVSVCRIRSLESVYGKSRVVRFLVRKGVPPVLLFLALSAGGMAAVRRFYKDSTYLALNLLGVAYPAWRCWHLVKEIQPQPDVDGRQKEYKAWLTYWMLYGSMQVLDAWAQPIREACPNYNVYKLLILYWAQNPYSNGAGVLCQHVLQKPIYDDDKAEKPWQQQRSNDDGYYQPASGRYSPAYAIPLATAATTTTAAAEAAAGSSPTSSASSSSSSSSYNDNPPSPVEEMTLTIETPHHHRQSILDGYTPTLQESDRASHKGFSIGDDDAAAPSW